MHSNKKRPEIVWVKRKCPICQSDTGNGECRNKNISDNIEFTDEGESPIMSAEFDGIEYPMAGEQCLFQQYNDWFVHFNYPISYVLAQDLSHIDGVERIHVLSKYRAVITIGEQFGDREVRDTIVRIYNSVINNHTEGASKSNNTVIQDIIGKIKGNINNSSDNKDHKID